MKDPALVTATSYLSAVRTHFQDGTRDLLSVLMNSTSTVEANLALQLLRDDIPEKVLVSACNIREVLAALPSSPFSMRVDEETLIKTAGLRRNIAIYEKDLEDDLLLAITNAGNLVLDIIIKDDDEKFFWNAVPIDDDFVTSEVLDLVIDSDYLLDAVVKLVQAMGIVFNPKFYMSLEDWSLDYAEDTFTTLGDLF